MMRYVELVHDSKMICLPLNISKKLHWQHLFEKQEEAENIITLISVDKPQTRSFWRTTSTIQGNGHHHYFFIRIPILYLATFWSILSIKLMFWLLQCNSFGYCSWIYFHLTFFKCRTNPLGSENLQRNNVNYPLVVSTNHCQSFSAFFCLMCDVQSSNIPFFASNYPQW